MDYLKVVAASANGILEPTALSSMVRAWLKEDVPSFDYAGAVAGDDMKEAILYAKQPGVVAGKPFVDAVFAELQCSVEWEDGIVDGSVIEADQDGRVKRPIAIVKGPARRILLGERTALNVLARCSGIATRASTFDKIVQENRWKGKVAGTRKLTPGFRVVEKYGMVVGGADMHRVDLSSMIMLKDNHIWSSGNITEAVKSAKALGGFALKVDVECRNFEEACEAGDAGADIVMLDNFSPDVLHETAGRLRALYPQLIIEASGGLTERTIAQYMGPCVDILSLSLAQNYSCLDFSLKIKY